MEAASEIPSPCSVGEQSNDETANCCEAVEDDSCTDGEQAMHEPCTDGEKPDQLASRPTDSLIPDSLNLIADSLGGISPVEDVPAVLKPGRDIHEDVVDIIGYLNEKSGKKFSADNEKTHEMIVQRIGEGYSDADFRRVIDNQVALWGLPPAPGKEDMRPFIRPSTLFGPKFEDYLNAGVKRSGGGNRMRHGSGPMFPRGEGADADAKLGQHCHDRPGDNPVPYDTG